jgi:uncharacterized protein YqfB (UPF0267 family)
MMMLVKMIIVLFCSGAIVATSGLPGFSQESTIRAKIGILVKSGDQTVRAKSKERLKPGDLIRIHVHPESSSYVYVVHTDQKQVTLLNMAEQKIQSSTMVLPSLQEYYQVDGKSSVENFTIICSPEEVKEISSLLASQIPYEKWASIEKDLAKKGEVDLNHKSERPFAIAGNVRGPADTGGGDPFVKNLQIFSGKSILVKQYEFSVKKQ